MQLPVLPPVPPMLAELSRELPEAEDLAYEPKWDGFRCIVFRDGAEIQLQSRNERPLDRYFPELVAGLLAALPDRVVLDGEIVIASDHGLDFDALLQRIHPAASRVRKLAAETPASFVAFDLLAHDDESLLESPQKVRRARLERLLGSPQAPLFLTPSTRDPSIARDWFQRFEGAGLDGVIAKRPDLPYTPGERVMIKVKHQRTADCVVGGYRVHKDGRGAGSLLLGLFDGSGTLHHVGVATGLSAALRKQLREQLSVLELGAGDAHPWAGAAFDGEQRLPGGQSRWTGQRDTSWVAVRPELVAEVAYDHLQGPRFRHATRFVRFRPDRAPESCTYDQLERVPPEELRAVFGARVA